MAHGTVLTIADCIAQVMIWDDHQNRCIGELSFRSQVSYILAVMAFAPQSS